MVPLSLTVRNFLSYRDSVTVDLSNLTIACLSGDNGAGKSALLDAMTWAIWGKSRAPREVDLISLGEDETEVTLIFAMRGREFRVMRRRTRTNRATLEFDSRSPGADNWLPIGGDSIRDTDARIVNELRLDYDTFVNSAFLQQGKADMFTENRPADRKRILAEILDLSVYDELTRQARAEMRGGNNRMDAIQTQIGKIDLLLAERHEFEVTLAELDERLELDNQEQETLRDAIETLRARLTAAEHTESAMQRASSRLARLVAQQGELDRRKERAASEIAELSAITAKEAEIRANAEALRTWRAQADRLSTALADRQPIEQRIARLDAAIQQARAAIEQELAVARQSARTAGQRLVELDEKQALLDQREREVEAGRREAGKLPELRAALVRDQDRLNELMAGNATLRSRMDEIRAKIDALSTGDAICPICRRPLADGDHQHIHDAWAAEGKQFGDAWRECAGKINALKSSVNDQRHEIERLDAVSTTLAGAEAQARQLRDDVRDRSQVEQSLRDVSTNVQRLDVMLVSSDHSRAETAELQQLRERLQLHAYDPEEHAEARRQLKRLEPAERELSMLEQAHSKLAGLTESLADLDLQLQQAAADCDETRKEIDELAAALEGIDEVRRDFETAHARQAEMAEARRALEQQRGALARRIEELEERSKEKLELEREAKELSARIDAYRELTTAFGQGGIQAMVIENVLPELEHEANRLLSRMTSKQLEVQFLTTREAVSTKSDIETLDIVIRDEAGRRPYQLFSGGEAFRINFAIRVALSKLLARRAGATVETLIVDEGFGTQDQQGRDGLIEALQSVGRDFQLILVITHIDEMRDQFPNRIEIVKTDAGSRATLI